MKLIITLLLFTILLSGCGLPEPLPTPKEQLKIDYATLLSDYNNLMMKADRLEKANAELIGNQDKCNELINAYSNLQTQYIILEAYYQSVADQYNALLPQIGSQNIASDKALKELNKQYMDLEKRQLEITTQIQAVHSKSVTLLSDNLTDIEYNAFYKGWELWWGSFNE